MPCLGSARQCLLWQQSVCFRTLRDGAPQAGNCKVEVAAETQAALSSGVGMQHRTPKNHLVLSSAGVCSAGGGLVGHAACWHCWGAMGSPSMQELARNNALHQKELSQWPGTRSSKVRHFWTYPFMHVGCFFVSTFFSPLV